MSGVDVQREAPVPSANGRATAGRAAPRWLLQSPGEAHGRAAPAGTALPRASFLERTLTRLGNFLESAFASEDAATRGGALQRIDPRVKVIATAALVCSSVFVAHLVTLSAFVVLALVLAALSRIGPFEFVRRSWVFVPLFTAVVALPAVTNLVTPGAPAVTLWSGVDLSLGPVHLPATLAVTVPGLVVAARLILRATAAVSFAVLLTMTTRWSDLLRALRVLGVPQVFVFVIAMAYRYVFLLLRLARDMFTARASRTVGRLSAAEERRFVGAAAGALFGKSQAMSEQVYSAMVARGYTGEARTLAVWRLRRADVAWAVAAVAIAVAALAFDRAL